MALNSESAKLLLVANYSARFAASESPEPALERSRMGEIRVANPLSPTMRISKELGLDIERHGALN